MSTSGEVITLRPVRQRSASQWRPGQTVHERTRNRGAGGSLVKWRGCPYTKPTLG